MSRTAGHLTAVCKQPGVLYKSLFHTHTHTQTCGQDKKQVQIYIDML